jgi:hypothetical protein
LTSTALCHHHASKFKRDPEEEASSSCRLCNKVSGLGLINSSLPFPRNLPQGLHIFKFFVDIAEIEGVGGKGHRNQGVNP